MNIKKLHLELVQHPSYQSLTDIQKLKTFMEFHVFAVWDFMSLLKRLQRELTCVEIPWNPSPYPDRLVRLINEIVLGEESDLDAHGNPMSHFKLYLEAMNEVGADTTLIKDWCENRSLSKIPEAAARFVTYHLNLAHDGTIEEVAGAFFWGREKLLPEVFQSIVSIIKKNELQCPQLIYYFERHIELDGDHHGPMSLECLDILCGKDVEKREKAERAAIKSLQLRKELWDAVLAHQSKDSLLAVGP